MMTYCKKKAFLALIAMLPVFAAMPTHAQLEEPGVQAVEEVVTIGRSRSIADQLIGERLNDSAAIDVLGAEAISRLGDSTVAAALRRVPGLTLVSDKFVYIRGLGERYSATSLNGAYVPSPDLTRSVLPLDIFPTSIVESLRVQKTYSPELPANFGGGSVDVRTRSIPDALTMQFEFGAGFNSETSGDVFTYAGGSDDKYGSDDGSRALSSELLRQIDRFRGEVNVSSIQQILQAENPALTDAQAVDQAATVNRELGALLNRDIGLETKSPNPDYGLKASIGNSFDLNGETTVGFLAGGAYETGWRNTESVRRNFQYPDERTDTERESTRNINLSGNLNLGLSLLAGEHEIKTATLFLRNTDDETAVRDFFNANREMSDGLGFRNYRFQFEERNMVVNQINGTHEIGDETLAFLPDRLSNLVDWIPNGAELTWFYSDARARTDIPNQVDVDSQTITDPSTGAVMSSAVALDATAADYRFTDLDDEVENYGWSGLYPLEFGQSFVDLSFGFQHTQKARTYRQDQFSFGPREVGDPSVLQGSLDSVFSDANIFDPGNNFVFDIQGTNNESYIAATMTEAVFIKADWTIKDKWQFAAGARWEDYKQVSVAWNPFGYSASSPQVTTNPDTLAESAFQKDEIFPAASLVYMGSWWAETFQLRFGYGESAVRPDLREISPGSYIDPEKGDKVDGCPTCVPALVRSYDIRGEWFFQSGDNLTATLFYKDIEDPIEFFESAASDTNISREIINAESAEVYGIELEGLKSLGFLGKAFSPFFLQGNLTVQDSELVAGEDADAPTNPIRKLVSSSDVVANVALGYDSADNRHSASLAYNVFGERLYVAGRNGAPDGFEQPFHSLDLIYSWYPTDLITVKAKFKNMLGEKTEIEREGVTTFVHDPGSTFSISFNRAF